MNQGNCVDQRILVQRSGRAMATEIHVQLAVAPKEEVAAQHAIDACMAWFAEVDERLSRFRPESDLSQLNCASGKWFAASDVLYMAVERSVMAAQASKGFFDPTLLPQLMAHGYDRDFSLIAHREADCSTSEPITPLSPGAWQSIEFDMSRRRIRLPAGSQIDLGGIAKGWAADVAIERYCASFAHALVNVGGDLRLRGGPMEGQGWSVGIRHPHAGFTDGPDTAAENAAVVTFSRGGLATSGALRRWWLVNGERRHHLLDPRTGASLRLWIDQRDDTREGEAPLIATATALAPTAARAEVAAKVALLRGYPAALHAVEKVWARSGPLGDSRDADAAVALALTLGSGEVALSANFGEYLGTWGTANAPLPVTWNAPTSWQEGSVEYASIPR